MGVQPGIQSSIVISGPNSAVLGQSVTLNATVNNAGNSYLIDWIKNNTIFATSAVPNISYVKQSANDTITALITPQSPGCYISSNSNLHIVSLISKINEITNQNLRLFPNPAKEKVTIKGLAKNDIVILWDFFGNKLFEQLINQDSIDFSYDMRLYSPGTYIFQIKNRNGNEKGNIKLLKK